MHADKHLQSAFICGSLLLSDKSRAGVDPAQHPGVAATTITAPEPRNSCASDIPHARFSPLTREPARDKTRNRYRSTASSIELEGIFGRPAHAG